MKKPNLFEYLNIIDFLKDLYKFRKTTELDFSYDRWATDLKFKSRGHLRDIIIGKAKISENLLPLFTVGLHLDEPSAEYFILLTRYSMASSGQTKETYGKTLLALWKAKLHQIEIQELGTFLSDSIIPVVFTYLSFEDTQSDLETIATELGYEIGRVKNALKCLIWQKLVDGHLDSSGQVRYKTVQPFFRVPNLPNNSFLRKFHLEGLKLAEDAQDLPTEKRKFYSYFVALSAEQFVEAQKIVQECNDRILSIFDSPQLCNRKIYRLNSQIFQVSGLSEKN